MTLRTRLFLVVGSLVALVVVAQWLWVRSLARELSGEVDRVAFSVGQSMASFFIAGPGDASQTVIDCRGDDCDDIGFVRPPRHAGEPHIEVVYRSSGGNAADGTASELRQVVECVGDDCGETLFECVGSGCGDWIEQRQGEPRHVVGQWQTESRETITFQTEENPGPMVSGEVSLLPLHLGGDTQFNVNLQGRGESRYLRVSGPNIERRILIPQRGFQTKIEDFSERLFLGSLAFLLVGLGLAAVAAHRISAPLRQLADAAQRVGDGELGTQVPAEGGGEVAQAIGAFNHMSKRLQVLDAHARELDAQRHLGEIGEIARGLAHTLRNPLNALGLSVDELSARTPDDSTSMDLAHSARRQIRRIDHSIRSFLALASQSGGVAEEEDLSDLARDVALEAMQDARGGVRIEVQGADEPRPLVAVAPELRAVIQALVVNAVEASPADGAVHVALGHGTAARWRVTIDDHGSGLPDTVRQRLFAPHTSTKATGSGMGLFLAHRITTRRYGGGLEVIDREGGGTRVVLELDDRTEARSVDGGLEL